MIPKIISKVTGGERGGGGGVGGGEGGGGGGSSSSSDQYPPRNAGNGTNSVKIAKNPKTQENFQT